MEVTSTAAATSWDRGRFDARDGPHKLLFGCMYEDAAIELGAFPAGGRIFCIASAGCTAMKLAANHEVVAVDINPVQLAYVKRRLARGCVERGAAERFLTFVRALGPLAGWSRSRVRAFLDMDNPEEQMAYWRRHLDTRRFRTGFDLLLSRLALRSIYAASFLHFLPPNFGAVMRGRMERCFARHSNRTNPYARALLLGEMPAEQPLHESPVRSRRRAEADAVGSRRLPAPYLNGYAVEVPKTRTPSVNSRPEEEGIHLVHADAASFLEREPAGSFDGFTLSNILDGANTAYEQRLFAAMKHTAAPGAIAVLRSLRESASVAPTNHAAEDRAMLWGIVDVRPVTTL